MMVTSKMMIIFVLISTSLLMGCVLISQIQQKKEVRTILLSAGSIILGSSFFLIGLSFLNTYQHLSSSYLGYLFKITPIWVHPITYETFFINKWFVIFSVALMAWLINIAFVYYTRWRYLFLTPVSSIMLATVLLYVMQFGRVTLSSQLIIVTLIMGMMMTIAPYLTSKMCQSDLEEKTTVGGFFYLNLWLCLGISCLFGRCETKTDVAIERFLGESRLKKRTGWIVFCFATLFSILFVFLSWIGEYDHHIRLLVFEQFVIEGISLQIFYLISLWIGLGCLFLTYRLLIPIYEDYFKFFRHFIPHAHVATDWLYQLKNTSSLAAIGFLLSYVASLVTLMYLSFYQWNQVVIPNLVLIGVVGMVVAKLGDQANGVKGMIMSSLMNGFLLTMLPTLSFYWFEIQQLEVAFGSIDYFFISQLLDILSIF